MSHESDYYHEEDMMDEINRLLLGISELEAENKRLILLVQFGESCIRDEKRIERAAVESALEWTWKHHRGDMYESEKPDYFKRAMAELIGDE